jgi:putative membrane protein
MMNGDGWMWVQGWGGWFLASVVMVLFLSVLITAIAVTIRFLGASASRESSSDYALREPEHFLAERLARGVIDEDEYRRRLSLLRLHR